ncbi:MAG: flagellar basal body rod protein FlgC [Syntrophomonadaceae bacterium]|nr:flagellar basal body rod protein FlgC [Syntrophomonadaceae bacterium]
MGLLNSGIDACASGLTAQRLRMDVIANNLANVNTTRTEGGGPFRRQVVVFESRSNSRDFAKILQGELEGPGGVRVKAIMQDESPLRQVYEPSHPDANEAGYVSYPNVNIVAEMTDMISATRSYEANITALESIKRMTMKAIEFGK